jgi:hypothetical protein
MPRRQNAKCRFLRDGAVEEVRTRYSCSRLRDGGVFVKPCYVELREILRPFSSSPIHLQIFRQLLHREHLIGVDDVLKRRVVHSCGLAEFPDLTANDSVDQRSVDVAGILLLMGVAAVVGFVELAGDGAVNEEFIECAVGPAREQEKHAAMTKPKRCQ